MSRQVLPTLRFVPTDALVLHEDADPRRVDRLMDRLGADTILRNPPVVAALGDGRYVVLDGANRVSSLCRLGIAHALVQVVDYDEVELSTWHHLITGMDLDRLLAALRGIQGARLTASDLDTAREMLARRRALAFVVLPQDAVCLVENGQSLRDGARILLDISNAYRGAADIHRIRVDSLIAVETMFENVTALLVYPPFTPADILALARDAAKVPTGITRHIIPGRVLRVNMPLARLSEARSLEEKNSWLDAWMLRKMAEKSVRYYAESTYSFDE